MTYTIGILVIICSIFTTHIMGECFTMPPKVMPVSTWSISIPNVNSPNFIHNTHGCPNSYELHSHYSHIESLVINTILNVKISTLNIYGYSVCCSTNIDTFNDECISDKYKEIIITPNEIHKTNETEHANYV
mgnify:CR=1 FL=1